MPPIYITRRQFEIAEREGYIRPEKGRLMFVCPWLPPIEVDVLKETTTPRGVAPGGMKVC